MFRPETHEVEPIDTTDEWHAATRHRDNKGVSQLDPSDLIDLLLNWEQLENSYYVSQKTKPTTTSAASACMKSARPDIYRRLIACSSLQGIIVITELNTIIAQLEAGMAWHPSRCAACIIHILGTQKKKKNRERMKSIIRKYLRTPNDQGDEFIKACKECDLALTAAELSTPMDLSQSPGFVRLDPLRNPHYETQWLNLWIGTTEALSHTARKRIDLIRLENDWAIPHDSRAPHPLRMRYRESIQDLQERTQPVLLKFVDACHISNKSERLPTDHQLATNLIRAIQTSPIKAQCEAFLQDPHNNEDGLDIDDLSYDALLTALRTTERRQKRSTALEDPEKRQNQREYPNSNRERGRQRNPKVLGRKAEYKEATQQTLTHNSRSADSGTPPPRRDSYKCRTCKKLHPYLEHLTYTHGTTFPCLELEEKVKGDLIQMEQYASGYGGEQVKPSRINLTSTHMEKGSNSQESFKTKTPTHMQNHSRQESSGTKQNPRTYITTTSKLSLSSKMKEDKLISCGINTIVKTEMEEKDQNAKGDHNVMGDTSNSPSLSATVNFVEIRKHEFQRTAADGGQQHHDPEDTVHPKRIANRGTQKAMTWSEGLRITQGTRNTQNHHIDSPLNQTGSDEHTKEPITNRTLMASPIDEEEMETLNTGNRFTQLSHLLYLKVDSYLLERDSENPDLKYIASTDYSTKVTCKLLEYPKHCIKEMTHNDAVLFPYIHKAEVGIKCKEYMLECLTSDEFSSLDETNIDLRVHDVVMAFEKLPRHKILHFIYGGFRKYEFIVSALNYANRENEATEALVHKAMEECPNTEEPLSMPEPLLTRTLLAQDDELKAKEHKAAEALQNLAQDQPQQRPNADQASPRIAFQKLISTVMHMMLLFDLHTMQNTILHTLRTMRQMLRAPDADDEDNQSKDCMGEENSYMHPPCRQSPGLTHPGTASVPSVWMIRRVSADPEPKKTEGTQAETTDKVSSHPRETSPLIPCRVYLRNPTQYFAKHRIRHLPTLSPVQEEDSPHKYEDEDSYQTYGCHRSQCEFRCNCKSTHSSPVSKGQSEEALPSIPPPPGITEGIHEDSANSDLHACPICLWPAIPGQDTNPVFAPECNETHLHHIACMARWCREEMSLMDTCMICCNKFPTDSLPPVCSFAILPFTSEVRQLRDTATSMRLCAEDSLEAQRLNLAEQTLQQDLTEETVQQRMREISEEVDPQLTQEHPTHTLHTEKTPNTDHNFMNSQARLLDQTADILVEQRDTAAAMELSLCRTDHPQAKDRGHSTDDRALKRLRRTASIATGCKPDIEPHHKPDDDDNHDSYKDPLGAKYTSSTMQTPGHCANKKSYTPTTASCGKGLIVDELETTAPSHASVETGKSHPECIPTTLPITKGFTRNHDRLVADDIVDDMADGIPSFITFDSEGRSLITTVDSCAEISLINKDVVSKSWRTEKSDITSVMGVGGKNTEISGIAVFNISFQYGSQSVPIKAYITNTPEGVELLIGIPHIRRYNIIPVLSTKRVIIDNMRLEINTEPAHVLLARKNHTVSLLMLCAGIGSGLTTLKELGFKIIKAHAVEACPIARKVLRSLHPEVEIICEDVMKLTNHQISNQDYNLLDFGSPCQPFSRCADNPHGFYDDRALPFLKCAYTKKIFLQLYPHAHFLGETVIVHPHIKHQHQHIQEIVMETKAITVQALDAGSLSARERRFFTNIPMDAQTVPVAKRSPEVFLPPGASMYPPHHTYFPCVVSSTDTHNHPSYLTSQGITPASPDDLDILQGFAEGVSDGGRADYTQGTLNLSNEARIDLIGNTFNKHQYAILIMGIQPTPRIPPCVWTINTKEVSIDTLEYTLSSYSHREKVQFFKSQLMQNGYEPTKCWIAPTEEKEGIPFQAKSGYSNVDNIEPIEYALKKAIESGLLTEVKYDPKFWISPLFGKSKQRKWVGTDIETFRVLWDLRGVNSALKRLPEHYTFFMPTVDEVLMSIPPDATHFATLDFADAYTHVRTHEDSLHMLVGIFNKRYYQALGMPQGLSWAPFIWTAHVTHGFNCAIGSPEWKNLWAIFIDDCIVWGNNEQQTLNRLQILAAVAETLDKPISEKCDAYNMTVHKQVKIVGIEITKGGNRISQSAVDALEIVLTEPPKSKSMLQHTLGTISYCKNAFEFEPQTLTKVADLISILRIPLTMTRFKWDEDQKTAAAQLKALISNSEKKLRDPNKMLTEHTSFVITSDASDNNIAAALWITNNPLAADTSLSDLQDPARSQLVDIKFKVISGGRKGWHVWEKELWSRIMAAIELGPFILSALCALSKRTNTPIDQIPRKVLFLGDSTTANYKWKSIDIPEDTTFLTAKRIRFLGWQDKIAMWDFIPHDCDLVPGVLNNLSHTVSHIADTLTEMIESRKKGTPNLWPIRLHTFHSDTKLRTHLEPPEGYVIHSLNLSTSQTEEVVRAYKADSLTKIKKVPINTLYEMLTNPEKTAITDIQIKARAWGGTRFWALSPSKKAPPLIYTQAATQRLIDFEKHDLGADLTKVLVLVIPHKADIDLTCARSTIQASMDDEHWANFWMRDHIIWSSHNTSSPHRTLTQTINLIQQKAWWPTLRADTKIAIDSCPTCVENRNANTVIGNSIAGTIRFGIVQADHKILKKEMALACGYPAILVITDITTGITTAAKAIAVDAVTTGRLFFTQWISQYGITFLVISDPGTGLAAQIMHTISLILGINDWSYGASGSAKHQGYVERRNSVLNSAMDDAWHKGQLNSGDDLDVAIAQSLISLNQLTITHGTTAFERTFAMKPRTIHMAQIASSNIDNIEIPTMDEISRNFLQQMIDVQKNTLEKHQIQQAEKSRQNALHREYTESKRGHVTTHFDLRVGDTISYGGIKWLLKHTEGPDPSSPCAAILERTLVNGRTQEVKAPFDELKPVCDRVYEHILPSNKDTQIGDFVLIDKDDTIFGGITTKISNTHITIQQYTPSPTGRTWIPEWEDLEKIKRCKKRPSISSTPVEIESTVESIMARGHWDQTTATIDQGLMNRLKSAHVLTLSKTDTADINHSCAHLHCTAGVHPDDAAEGQLYCDECLPGTESECIQAGGRCSQEDAVVMAAKEHPYIHLLSMSVFAMAVTAAVLTPSPILFAIYIKLASDSWAVAMIDSGSEPCLFDQDLLTEDMVPIPNTERIIVGLNGVASKPTHAYWVYFRYDNKADTRVAAYPSIVPAGTTLVFGHSAIDALSINIFIPEKYVTIGPNNIIIRMDTILALNLDPELSESHVKLANGNILQLGNPHVKFQPSYTHSPRVCSAIANRSSRAISSEFTKTPGKKQKRTTKHSIEFTPPKPRAATSTVSRHRPHTQYDSAESLMCTEAWVDDHSPLNDRFSPPEMGTSPCDSLPDLLDDRLIDDTDWSLFFGDPSSMVQW